MDFRGCVTFADLAHHYAEHELEAHTTIRAYERVLRNRLLPRWGNRVALSVEPLEVEQWLKSLKGQEGLANPTLDRTRRVMSLVYKHGQRYGLIPRNAIRYRTISSRDAEFERLLMLTAPKRSLDTKAIKLRIFRATVHKLLTEVDTHPLFTWLVRHGIRIC